MAVTLHAQAPVTVDEARRYLLDQGFPSDGGDMLKIHINAITSMMLNVMGRTRIKWIDDDEITEYRDGDGSTEIWTRDAPIRKLVSVQVWPLATTPGSTYTGPTEPALSNDDTFFDPDEGIVVLKRTVFPDGRRTVKLVYEAGFYDGTGVSPNDVADHQFNGLKAIALDALATKWKRFANQRHGIDSETKQETTVTYSDEDFNRHAMRDLKRFRRSLFV